MYVVRKRYRCMRDATIALQALLRGYMVRNKYQMVRNHHAPCHSAFISAHFRTKLLCGVFLGIWNVLCACCSVGCTYQSLDWGTAPGNQKYLILPSACHFRHILFVINTDVLRLPVQPMENPTEISNVSDFFTCYIECRGTWDKYWKWPCFNVPPWVQISIAYISIHVMHSLLVLSHP